MLMARPGFRNHRKFRRLAQLVGMPEPHVFGHVEFIWSGAYESGDPFLGDADDVELAAAWTGKRGMLCTALLDCGGKGNPGLIEPVDGQPAQYQIHDLFDHAPNYVQKRMQRESDRTAKGKSISDIRSEAAKKRWEGGSGMQADANGMQTKSTCRQLDANGRTPAPAPALNTSAVVGGELDLERGAIKGSNLPTDDEIYKAYPRKVAPKAAKKAIAAAVRDLASRVENPRAHLLARTQEYAKAKRGADKKFIPYPKTWFNQGRYDDESEEWALTSQSRKSNGDARANGHAIRQPAQRLLTLGET
jgi:hypothetical protein